MKRFTMMVAACAGIAAAAGFQVQGNIDEAWDKSALTVRTEEGGARLWFNLPAHSGITVVAKPDSGATVTSRLNMSSTVDLRLPSTYEMTITRDSGSGQWTCKDAFGSPALIGFGTSVDVKRHARVTYVADDDEDIWTFSWPKEATFLVQLPDASGKVTQEQDLYDSSELELVGGGSFTFDIAPTDGSGEFTARKSE